MNRPDLPGDDLGLLGGLLFAPAAAGAALASSDQGWIPRGRNREAEAMSGYEWRRIA